MFINTFISYSPILYYTQQDDENKCLNMDIYI